MSASTRVSQIVFGERLRALRVLSQKTVEEFADEVDIAHSTYRRLERGETEKIPFDDVVRIGLAHRLSPNEVAALADLWALDPDEAGDRKLAQEFETLFNRVLQVNPNKRETLVGLFHALIDVELRKTEAPDEEEVSLAALPEWARRRPGG